MKYHPYKMTTQSVIAVTHLAMVATLFAALQLSSAPMPIVEQFVGWTFFVLITPIGLFGVAAATPCRCGQLDPSGLVLAGLAFAANSYLWAWAITGIWNRIKRRPNTASEAIGAPR